MRVCESVCVCVPLKYRGYRATQGSPLSPSTNWVLGIELKLGSQNHYPWATWLDESLLDRL